MYPPYVSPQQMNAWLVSVEVGPRSACIEIDKVGQVVRYFASPALVAESPWPITDCDTAMSFGEARGVRRRWMRQLGAWLEQWVSGQSHDDRLRCGGLFDFRGAADDEDIVRGEQRLIAAIRMADIIVKDKRVATTGA